MIESRHQEFREQSKLARLFGKPGEMGDRGERAVILAIRERKWRVVPYTDIERDGAPKLIGPYETVCVLPDLEIFPGKAVMCGGEVKTKEHWTVYRKDGRARQHGYSQRLHQHYVRWQDETGFQLIVFVVENCTGEILARSLNKLQVHHSGMCRNPSTGRMENTYYFNRDQFLVFDQGTPADLPLFKDVQVAPTLASFGNIGDL